MNTNTCSVKGRDVSGFILPVVLFVFLVPFMVLTFYSLPATDDFCKATLSFGATPRQQGSIFAVTWLYYTQWSPRWLTTLLQSAIMSRVDLVGAYGWLLSMVIVANLASLWYFFKVFFRLRVMTSLLAAAIFYAAYVASLSDAPQELYWLTGAIEYNLSFSSILMLVSLLYEARPKTWYYLALVILSVAVPAQHEIAGTFLCALLFFVVLYRSATKSPARQWRVSLILALLSQVVVVLAPGNVIRAAQEHRNMWDIAHTPRWVAHAFYHGLSWPASPAILVAACCILLLCQRDAQLTGTDTFPPAWLGVAALVGLIFVVCEVAFVETATGVWLPYRVSAWFQFMFWLLLVCVIAAGIPELYRIKYSEITRTAVFVLFAIILLGCSNYRSALEDLHGPVQAWHSLGYQRLHEHGGVLIFEPIRSYPNLTFHQNLSSDAGCFVNACLAHYLDAKAVVVKDSNEECPH